MYCCIIWHFCSISDTKKIEKMQLKALRHIYKDYTSSYEMLREKCNRPMLLTERQKVMLLEVYKCIHELLWPQKVSGPPIINTDNIHMSRRNFQRSSTLDWYCLRCMHGLILVVNHAYGMITGI